MTFEKCTKILVDTDKNSDGITTISDIGGVVSDVLTLPFRILHDVLAGGRVYEFFEMSPESCGSGTAYLVGGIFYILIFSFR